MDGFTDGVAIGAAKVDEPGSFTHTIRITPRDAGSRVESTVQYAHSAPLQTLLNALGGWPGGRSPWGFPWRDEIQKKHRSAILILKKRLRVHHFSIFAIVSALSPYLCIIYINDLTIFNHI